MKMKNIIVFLLSIVLFFGLFLLYDFLMYDKAIVDAGLSEYSKKVDKSMYFEAIIEDITEEMIVVKPTESVPILGENKFYYEYLLESSQNYYFYIEDVEIDCELEIGKIVSISYTYTAGMDAFGRNRPILLHKVNKVTDLIDTTQNEEDIILYNGRRYNKHWLCSETLDWLELSDEEKENSEYYPKDLVEQGYFDLLSNIEEWGLRTRVGGVYPTQMSVDIYQKDFIETELNNDWVYSVDSKFEIEKFNMVRQQWFKVETLYGDKEIPWDDGVEILELDSEVPYGYGINWEWLYGELPKGEYRIKKEIRVDKSENDYSWRTVYWYFEIKEY